MSWDLRALGGAVQLPCGELAWTKPQIFRVLASVEAMRGVVLGGDVLFGNGTYTGSSWQYCLSCEDHYVAFLRENCRGSRRTARHSFGTFWPRAAENTCLRPCSARAWMPISTAARGALLRAMTAPHGRAADCPVTVCRKSPLDFSGKEILLRCRALQTRCGVCAPSGWVIRTG